MKCAIVYNPSDRKLLESSYSWTYKDQFDALVERFEQVIHITRPCSANDIDADAIIFYDVHSTHDIKIDGIENHRAVKIEYFNDPHQEEQDFERDGVLVHKLGAESRTKRALERGVTKIICPVRKGFYDYIAPYLCSDADRYLLYFPVAPKQRLTGLSPLRDRMQAVLANGSVWVGTEDFKPYEFRSWAFGQRYVDYSRKYAVGQNYQAWLSTYAGALALCDVYVVPKYLEIPLSGCLCFAQELQEYKDLGFKNYENCIFVNKDNLETSIKEFLNDVSEFQVIADNGRKLAEKYTADKFAEFIYKQL